MNTDTFHLITKCVEEIERRQLNIAGGRSDWVSLSYEFASIGESGRDLFHRCAQLDSSYLLIGLLTPLLICLSYSSSPLLVKGLLSRRNSKINMYISEALFSIIFKN